MCCHQWISTIIPIFLLLSSTVSWSYPHLQDPCQSCHSELAQVPAHPFLAQLPSSQIRNPRCMRCHNPSLFKALSSGTVKTLTVRESSPSADTSCKMCHSSAKQMIKPNPKDKTKVSLVNSDRHKLTWLARCQTCHSPPFSKVSPPSLQKALHQLKQTHTISDSISKSSKTRLDSSSTFQVHQSPPSIHP